MVERKQKKKEDPKNSRPYGYIYLAQNKETGSPYVGQTVTNRWGENQKPIKARWNEGCTEAERKKRNGETLREVEEAIITHGRERFKLEEID